MKKSILNLEGVQVLSRNEQKNVNGGLRACKIVFLKPDGTSYTKSGTCDTSTSFSGMLCENCPMPSATTTSFCNVGDGVMYSLTSNGGNSYC